MLKVEVVTIGDELLLGFTIDTNAAHLARALAAIGIEISRRSTVGDSADEIALAVREALERSDGVVTTGGLGPTSDDMTKPSIAAVFGRAMVRDEAIVQWLRDRWARMRRKGPMPESNMTQSMIPEGSEIIPNSQGSAPGIWLEDERGKWVAMLPGVPREMRAMVSEQLIPRLSARMNIAGGTGTPSVIMSRTLRTTGIAESALADLLGPLGRSVDGLAPAFLPGVEGVDIRLTVRGLPESEAKALLADATAKLRSVIGRYIYGEGNVDLAAVVLDLCRVGRITLSVAESCTGGLLGARVTAVPGSSEVFVGGVLAYDNSVKISSLGVESGLIVDHGAVSEEVAVAMAEGARKRMGTEIALSITGIAGPDGGSPDKPAGTIWIALAGPRPVTLGVRLFGDRNEIRARAAQAALDLLRRQLQSG